MSLKQWQIVTVQTFGISTILIKKNFDKCDNGHKNNNNKKRLALFYYL